MTLAGTAVVMLYAAGAESSHLVGLAVLSAPGLYWAIMKEDYRRRRFLAFLNPEADPQDAGFHIIQSLYALGSGGLLGVGLGQSRQKFSGCRNATRTLFLPLSVKSWGCWEHCLYWGCSCYWLGADAEQPC